MHNKQEKRTKFLNSYLDVYYSVEFQPCAILEEIEDRRITSDRELMMRAVKADGLALQYYTGTFQCNSCESVVDDELVAEAVKSNGMSIRFMLADDPQRLISKEILRKAIEEDGLIASFGNVWSSLSDEEKILAASTNGNILVSDQLYGILAPKQVATVGLIDSPYDFCREFQTEDKEVIEYVIKCYGAALEEIDDELLCEPLSLDVLKEGFSQYPEALPHLFWNLRRSMDEIFEIVREGLKSYNDVLDEDIGQGFFTKEQFTELLKYSGYIIYDYFYTTDREMALVAVTNCGEVLGVLPEFANDKEIVLAAVQQDAYSILYGTEALIYNRDFILECVKISGEVLDYIDMDFDEDYEIILEAVQNYGDAIGITSQELRRNKEIITAALSNNGLSLGYLDEDLQDDKSIVLLAVSNNGLALEYASDRLQNDKEVVMVAVSNMPISLQYASEALRSDMEVILRVVSLDYHALELASEQARNNRDIVMECVKICGLCLLNASDELKNDREIVLQAVSQNGLALKYATTLDEEIAITALQNNSTVFNKLPNHLKRIRKIAKLAKDESDTYWEAWIDYWGKRSEVFDIERPKRKRLIYGDCEEEDNEEENDIQDIEERERKKLKDE
ncbi:predicted protein [Naegleria gruberi]|uniref:Predicted protein n=1 Tax=Naegleria gruberi TaxID=5762 RepID=D2V4I6_NAEGR|nr:uncharacterized protein NAEGRDRAFT_63743 [Naegleria gruberi]EFC48392.1 predicted protein [Naegleria gruberi]|eukprot:XP_002681136.1 predicted protein [Naegleria gruberi strain NEG-M]